MGLIPNEIINAVLERSDIVAVISRYLLLKKAGRNFKALCPFHQEKSESFVVNPDKQIFHCFGCGAGGNAVGFVMRQERLEFPQAVRLLADQCSVTIPETGNDHGPTRSEQDDIYKVNGLAVEYFHENLLMGKDSALTVAREYLKGRGVNLEIVRSFSIGFAANAWDGLITFLTKKGIGLELMEKAGLVIAREGKAGFYDRFRNRIIFPIFDIQSRPIAFGARALKDDEGAKYINSPETAVYTKGRHLFGFNQTKNTGRELDQVIVVEGYMDMIMPFIHGVKNITASLGTALTPQQIRLIRRYTPNVVMLFDTDPAGQNAIVRSLDLLVEEGMNVHVVKLAQAQDPDSFIRSNGIDAFNRCLSDAQDLYGFKMDWHKQQFGTTSMEGRSKICQQMMATISRFKDEVVKFELTKRLSEEFKIPVDVLLKLSSPQEFKHPLPAVVSNASAKPQVVHKSSEEMLLALFLNDVQWLVKAKEVLRPEDFSPGLMQGLVHTLWQKELHADQMSVQGLLADEQDVVVQALVAKLLSYDASFLVDPARVFEDCVVRVVQARRKTERQELIEQIRQAEVESNTGKLEELREQLTLMMKK